MKFDLNEERRFKPYDCELKWSLDFRGYVNGSYNMLVPKHKQVEEQQRKIMLKSYE